MVSAESRIDISTKLRQEFEEVNNETRGAIDTWKHRASDFRDKSQRAAYVAVGATLTAVQLEASGVRNGAIAAIGVGILGALASGTEILFANASDVAADQIQQANVDLGNEFENYLALENANSTGTTGAPQ